MKKNLFVYFTALLALAACHKHSDKHAEAAEAKHSTEQAVLLNNGNRWEANPETTNGINTMVDRIRAFQEQGSTDYVTLQNELNEEFKTIFQKCTMKGEAHNQLHNYLMPLKKELDKLSADNIESVNSYLKTYPMYFQ